MMCLKQQRSTHEQSKASRFLITVNVLGSTGPLRLFVNGKELVADVIDTALKTYAHEDRLPVIGSFDVDDFLLYRAIPEYTALCPSERIGSCHERAFVLCRKRSLEARSDERPVKMITKKGGTVTCKKWFKKSISFKVR